MAKKKAPKDVVPEPITGRGRRGPPKRWIVMVFMGAAPIAGMASLTEYANADIEEMTKAVAEVDTGHLAVFVERHDADSVSRVWIGGSSLPQPPSDTNTAEDGTALTTFIEVALNAAKYDERDDRCMLVLWGHAYQFAIARRQGPSGIDALDFAEFRAVLEKFQTRMNEKYPGTTARLDVLGFDACDLSTIEVANALAPFACYLVSSEIGVPLPGWPYYKILSRLGASDPVMSPPDLGSFVVRKFCEEYQKLDEEGRLRAVSMTLLDLEQAERAFCAAETLAIALAQAGGEDDAELAILEDQFVRSQTEAGKPFIDVADFCLNLSRSTANEDIADAAAALGDILVRPRPDTTVRGSFIVEHGRNAHDAAKLHGVSLYAPQILAGSQDWRGGQTLYNKLALNHDTLWSRLVHVLAEGC